jgi:hypothetical protein
MDEDIFTNGDEVALVVRWPLAGADVKPQPRAPIRNKMRQPLSVRRIYIW